MRRPSGFRFAVLVLGMVLLLPAGAFAQAGAAAGQGAAPPVGIVHTVVEGDTLWDLSAKHLGTPWKWTEIWERNRFVTNPHYLYPGTRIVIVPPGPKEATISVEYPAEAAAPAPEAVSGGPQPAAKAALPAPAPAPEPYLDIPPADFVRAGEFLREAPRGMGRIQGGRDPKVGFSYGDSLYLSLDKTVPAGQLLAVYRVRGPVRVSGKSVNSGYVKYLVGILQVGPTEDGRVTAKVRQSFEDLTRDDLVSEEIPAYTRVKIFPGGEGMRATVMAGRMTNKEMATGDFVYLDGGSSSGVEVGNVFRVFTPTGLAAGATTIEKLDAEIDAAQAVVIRVGKDFSTAYVARSTQSFEAGVQARRGIPAK
jgi:LysM repeat protein